MKKTFVDVLLELPVDTALRNFLTGHGLVMPDDFAWDDTPPTSQALVDAIRAWPDIPARDRLTWRNYVYRPPGGRRNRDWPTSFPFACCFWLSA